ncbi:MAG: phage virion morphogenesis protein [Terracidiphilus sp.]|nr:phage virion morphogenesis protein [Terracidiphilus sp.]
MATEVIKVDESRAVVALGRFHLSLQQHEELSREIGASQLVSVRRTFREQGSPANSWVPLSPNTIKRDPKRYGPGHKLLIGKSTLLNSITYAVQGNSVVIGTVLKYAAVHQFGSRDRGAAIGPRTKAQSEATVKVGEHSYQRMQSRYVGSFEKLQGEYVARRVAGPAPEGHKRVVLRTKLIGPRNLVTEKIRRIGPRNLTTVKVGEHARHQNIPPRPYCVFRPEDPARIRGLVNRYVIKSKKDAGLGGTP